MSDSEHKHVSKAGEARRLEIFTGAGRRRRRSAEAKAQIVAESYPSGTTVSSVARRHGLTVQRQVMLQHVTVGEHAYGIASRRTTEFMLRLLH